MLQPVERGGENNLRYLRVAAIVPGMRMQQKAGHGRDFSVSFYHVSLWKRRKCDRMDLLQLFPINRSMRCDWTFKPINVIVKFIIIVVSIATH